MHCTSILSRLLYWCFFLVGLSLFSQCNCKNPNQQQGKKSQGEKDNKKDHQEEHGRDNTNPQPKPPVPNPPPVGPVLQNITEGDLRVMESVFYSDGGSASFLVDMLRDLKKDPSKVDVGRRDDRNDGATILHAAVKYGVNKGEEIIREVLKLGVDINAKDDNGQTPLHLAIMKGTYHGDSGEPTFLKILLERGAAIDAPDGRGNTPLHVATNSGTLRHLQALLPKVTLAQLNQLNLNGHSPLHVAVLNGNLAAVQALINKGADMKLNTPDGKNALHLAAARGNFDIVKALVDAGADKTSKTSNSKTALELTQDTRIINFLGGVAPNVPTVEDSLVQVIETAGYQFLADKLRRQDQDIDSTDPTEDHTTALQQAARLGNNDAVKMLLAHGADIHLPDSSFQTALHKAAEAGHLEVVKTLLAHGATIDLADNDGCTPLLLAGFAGKRDVVKVLVEDYGANINAKSHSGGTLLHRAAETNNLSLLQYLLSKKALVNLRGRNRQTPLYVAAAHGYEQVVQALIQEGADVNALGMTSPDIYTLSVAINNKHIGVVKRLLQAGAQVRQEDVDQAPTEEMKQLLQQRLTN